jgi:type I restriction enzyme S subunit
MGVRPGYKRTEVGVIPEEWEVSTVGREFDIQLGKMLDAEKNVGIAKPYLGNKSVQWGRVDTTELQTMRMSPADLQRFRLCRGDLLVCEGGEVGRAALWEDQLPECYYQKALHRLRPLNGFDSRLMVACLRFWVDHEKLGDFVSQTSIAHLTKEKFSQVPMAVPPRDEQRAIATALSDADALLTQLDRLIAKKRDIKQAAMQQLLTGKTRLPGFGGAWVTRAIGELGTTYGGLVGKSKADFGTGDVQYVTFLNVMGNSVVNPMLFDRVRVPSGEPQNLVRQGDLLFNGSSETPEEVGMCALVACDVPNLYLNSFCFGLRLRDEAKVDGLFLTYLIRGEPGRDMMKSLAQGSTRYNISKAALRDAAVSIPGLQEQTAIATILSDLDAELTALEARRDKTHALKQGMMQELLTGRTRLA